jgi:hypothetical protein
LSRRVDRLFRGLRLGRWFLRHGFLRFRLRSGRWSWALRRTFAIWAFDGPIRHGLIRCLRFRSFRCWWDGTLGRPFAIRALDRALDRAVRHGACGRLFGFRSIRIAWC